MSGAPTLNSIAPWYGSKRTLAPVIVAQFGRHGAYCEPFCGSLAVLLAKPVVPMEICNDLHGDLVNLARVLASPQWTELHGRVERTLMATDLYLELRDELAASDVGHAPSLDAIDESHVRRAWAFLVVSWIGINGVAGTHRKNFHPARRYTSGGGNGATRWKGVAQSMPHWHERLRSVVLDRMDAFTLLERLDDAPEWVVYCDPPYLKKGDRYLHDFTPADHERLAGILRRFRQTRVVCSYYDEPELRGLYDGWTFIECPVTKGLVNQGRRDQGGAVSAPEVLIINGESFTTSEGLF